MSRTIRRNRDGASGSGSTQSPSHLYDGAQFQDRASYQAFWKGNFASLEQIKLPVPQTAFQKLLPWLENPGQDGAYPVGWSSNCMEYFKAKLAEEYEVFLTEMDGNCMFSALAGCLYRKWRNVTIGVGKLPSGWYGYRLRILAVRVLEAEALRVAEALRGEGQSEDNIYNGMRTLLDAEGKIFGDGFPDGVRGLIDAYKAEMSKPGTFGQHLEMSTIAFALGLRITFIDLCDLRDGHHRSGTGGGLLEILDGDGEMYAATVHVLRIPIHMQAEVCCGVQDSGEERRSARLEKKHKQAAGQVEPQIVDERCESEHYEVLIPKSEFTSNLQKLIDKRQELKLIGGSTATRAAIRDAFRMKVNLSRNYLEQKMAMEHVSRRDAAEIMDLIEGCHCSGLVKHLHTDGANHSEGPMGNGVLHLCVAAHKETRSQKKKQSLKIAGVKDPSKLASQAVMDVFGAHYSIVGIVLMFRPGPMQWYFDSRKSEGDPLREAIKEDFAPYVEFKAKLAAAHAVSEKRKLAGGRGAYGVGPQRPEKVYTSNAEHAVAVFVDVRKGRHLVVDTVSREHTQVEITAGTSSSVPGFLTMKSLHDYLAAGKCWFQGTQEVKARKVAALMANGSRFCIDDGEGHAQCFSMALMAMCSLVTSCADFDKLWNEGHKYKLVERRPRTN